MLSARLEDPTGYGRVVRIDGEVVAIVEEPDATSEQRTIDEVNTSVYAFEAGALRENLGKLDTDNAQGEMYLTDVIGLLTAAGQRVAALPVDASEAQGVNDPAQLAAAGDALSARSAPKY